WIMWFWLRFFTRYRTLDVHFSDAQFACDFPHKFLEKLERGVVRLLDAAGEGSAVHETLGGVGRKFKGQVGDCRTTGNIFGVAEGLGGIDTDEQVEESGTVGINVAAITGCIRAWGTERNITGAGFSAPRA